MLEAPFYILIATHGRNTLLKRTLESFCRTNLPKLLVKIIIVENGEKYDTETVVSQYTDKLPIQYLYTPDAGKSNALNIGLRAISEENSFVFFTDDDVRFSIDVLTDYYQYALDYGIGHYFGGPISVDYENTPEKWIRPFFPASARGWSIEKGSEKQIKYFLGFNWGAWKKDIEEAGSFSKYFGPGSITGATGQESDMQDRLFENGVKPIYVENARVYHFVPKERTTVNWVLKRSHRRGKQEGLKNHFFDKDRLIFGYAKALLLKCIMKLPRVFFAMLFFREEKRMRILNEYALLLGMLEGVKKRRKNSSTKIL